MNITAKVISCLNKYLDKKNGEYIVGVSGGVDSMVLMDSLQKGGYSFDACFVIHNQSPEEQAQKELIQEYCNSNNITLHINDLGDLRSHKIASSENIARIKRYEYFSKISSKKQVLLGHHIDDQTETVLFKIIRGTGIAGIAGMPQKREHKTQYGTFDIIRPFLKDLAKTDLYEYASHNNVKFIEDSTNEDNYFSRNFLRNKVIPLITEKFPHFNKSILNLTENAADAVDALDYLSESLLETNRISMRMYAVDWNDFESYEKRLFIIGLFKFANRNKVLELEKYLSNNKELNEIICGFKIVKSSSGRVVFIKV